MSTENTGQVQAAINSAAQSCINKAIAEIHSNNKANLLEVIIQLAVAHLNDETKAIEKAHEQSQLRKKRVSNILSKI